MIVALALAALAVGTGTAGAAVPGTSSGGSYTVAIGAERTGFSNGEGWQGIDLAAGRLRPGANGFGAFYVIGNTGEDPHGGDRAGWKLTVPTGLTLKTFSADVGTGSWVGQRWTSGLRYTLAAHGADGAQVGAPFLACEPTPTANACPDTFHSDATRVFAVPAGARSIELRVECVLDAGCSRTANPDGGPGGNEYAAVTGATFAFEDATAPALTSGSGDVWSDASRWFHNASSAAATMGATDNSGIARMQWYVDGALAYDTGGATSAAALFCDFSFFKPCSDSSAQFTLDRSLFTIPDGSHELTVVARDAAGNVSPSLTRRFRVDDTAPPRVTAAVREGSELRDPGPWHLDFTVPLELDGAPLQTAWYRLCAATNERDCTAAEAVRAGVEGLAPGSRASVAVTPPNRGDWTVHLWLQDAAGNGDEANASEPALIRYGQSAPVADPDAPPTLTGDFTDGSRVHASSSGFKVAGGAEYAFQWMRCDASGEGCTAVPGATAQDYVLVHADARHRMRARVTASNAKGSDSAVTGPSQPVALLPPSHGSALLSGVMRSGEELRVEDASFDGTPPFDLAYTWLRCSSGACDPIDGADGDTYVLSDEDVGQTIRARVVAANSAGSSAAEAARADGGDGEPVSAAPPRSVTAPGAPAGERTVGRTLVADDGEWAGTRPMTFSYVWQRCSGASGACVAIPGAVGRSYVLDGADLGRAIRVLVSARNGGAVVGPVASARTGPVEAGPQESGEEEPGEDAPAPVISGPAPPPGPTPAPTPSPDLAPSAPSAPSGPALPAAGDLSRIPGNLVGAATCKVVRTGPKKRRTRLRGMGAVTFAAAAPSRVTDADPLVLTLRARRGAVRSVAYRAGSRAVGRSRRAPYRVAVRPRLLRAGGTQVLTAIVSPKGRARPGRVAMRLNVSECPSLLTAGIRFSGARAITQLRVFSRTGIRGGTLTLPAPLVPKLRPGRRAGTLTLTGADGRPRGKALVAGTGGRLRAHAGISVRRSGRRLVLGGIPAGTGVVALDLTGPRRPAWRLLRGKRLLRFGASVRADGLPPQRLLAAIRPAARR